MTVKILLIDDEPFIHRYLKNLLKDSKLDYQIVGDAYDGEQGLTLALKYVPDLIFCDIKMPVMDGLDFCSALGERGLPCKIVLLTAYRDFNYAKRAVSLPVAEYLLKPISSEDFQALVDSLSHSLSMEREKQLAALLYQALYNREALPDALLSDGSRFFYLITCQYGSINPKRGDLDTGSARLRFESWVNRWRVLADLWKITPMPDHMSIIFLASSSDCSPSLTAGLMDYLRSTGGPEIPVNIGFSGPFPHSAPLSDLLVRQQKNSRKYAVYAGSQITVNDIPAMPVDNGPYSIESICPKLSCAVLMDDQKQLLSSLPHLLAYCRERHISQLLLSKLLKELFLQITSFHSTGQDTRLLDFELLLEDLINGLFSYDDLLPELETFIKELYSFISSLKLEEAACSNLPELIEDYLMDNYDKNINLKILADKFHASCSHICRVYKQYYGISLTDSLTAIRISHAMQLLCSSLPISDIAARVGYNDPYYFSRVFKQTAGCSPSKYREDHSSPPGDAAPGQ